jgi:hypothetical protein
LVLDVESANKIIPAGKCEHDKVDDPQNTFRKCIPRASSDPRRERIKVDTLVQEFALSRHSARQQTAMSPENVLRGLKEEGRA